MINPLLAWIQRCLPRKQPVKEDPVPSVTNPLPIGLTRPRDALPVWVSTSPTAMRYYTLLSPMSWNRLSSRMAWHPLHGGVIPHSTLRAAMLVRLEEGLVSMGHLHRYLREHPALAWLLGFPNVPDQEPGPNFDTATCLPTSRHLTRLLRQMPNACAQLLLDGTVALIAAQIAGRGILFGDAISLDTKHILAWVRENNPKDYVSDRYVKGKQPKGDPDCRLGCKRQRNVSPTRQNPLPTPSAEAVPARTLSVGEFYWGYASGVVVTKVDDHCEVVLAELTQPFDCSDVSYFFPLMAETERRLGNRPRFGTFDAAFDAFYVYEYFHEAGGFAAVPWAGRADHRKMFSDEGLPLCPTGLAMPRRSTFQKQSYCLYPHLCVRYACPLLYPHPSGQRLPNRPQELGQ